MIHETAVTTESSLFFNVSLVCESRALCTLGRCCKREVCQLLWVLLPVAVYWLALAGMQMCSALKGTSYCFFLSNEVPGGK